MIDPMQRRMGGDLGPMSPAAPPPADPGMGLPEPGMGLEPSTPPEPAPEPPPLDPTSAAIDQVLTMPGPDAIRKVYQLATSAARAKSRIEAAGDQLNPRKYHELMQANPEARYARELIAARKRLDALAQERRRIVVDSQQQQSAIYDIQLSQINAAMEQVAGGTLLFLALPGGMNE